MFIAALFINQNWKDTKYPSTEEKITKLWNIHTMEFYCDQKEMLTHATPWMKQHYDGIKGIISSDWQAQKCGISKKAWTSSVSYDKDIGIVTYVYECMCLYLGKANNCG